MNFTSSEYLYPHSFTLPMVTCTVQKVGRKSVDFHGNGMCLYYSSISWLRGNSLKIGLRYLVKQWLVFELWNYISSYVSHWTNSKSRRKPLADIVRSESLRRVSQVVNIIHHSLRQCLDIQNYHRSLNSHTKLNQVVHVYMIKNYRCLYTSSSLWSSWYVDLLSQSACEYKTIPMVQ